MRVGHLTIWGNGTQEVPGFRWWRRVSQRQASANTSREGYQAWWSPPRSEEGSWWGWCLALSRTQKFQPFDHASCLPSGQKLGWGNSERQRVEKSKKTNSKSSLSYWNSRNMVASAIANSAHWDCIMHKDWGHAGPEQAHSDIGPGASMGVSHRLSELRAKIWKGASVAQRRPGRDDRINFGALWPVGTFHFWLSTIHCPGAKCSSLVAEGQCNSIPCFGMWHGQVNLSPLFYGKSLPQFPNHARHSIPKPQRSSPISRMYSPRWP